jgi:curved DNA-binding protein CbpA
VTRIITTSSKWILLLSEAYAVLIDAGKREVYDRTRRSGRQGDFRFSQEDLFRDLFSNQAASAIFEELAREFERRGMRVDRQYFHQTLFGGRTVVTGGIFVISPLAPLLGLLRFARIALPRRRQPEAAPVAGSRILAGIGRVARWLLDRPQQQAGLPQNDMTLSLALTLDEARTGGKKPVVIPSAAGREQLLVTIPAGIRSGTRLRLRGKGRVGPGGDRGDLYLVVETSDLNP